MKRLLIGFIASMMFFVGCDALPILSPIISLYIKWVEGEAHAYFAADRDSTHRAVKRALLTLDHPLLQDDLMRSGDRYLVAGNNDRFKIKVIAVEPYVTRVSIRVNIMGDKPYAEMIYRELMDELDVIEYQVMRKRLAKQKLRPRL